MNELVKEVEYDGAVYNETAFDQSLQVWKSGLSFPSDLKLGMELDATGNSPLDTLPKWQGLCNICNQHICGPGVVEEMLSGC